jgi:ribosomal protein L9
MIDQNFEAAKQFYSQLVSDHSSILQSLKAPGVEGEEESTSNGVQNDRLIPVGAACKFVVNAIRYVTTVYQQRRNSQQQQQQQQRKRKQQQEPLNDESQATAIDWNEQRMQKLFCIITSMWMRIHKQVLSQETPLREVHSKTQEMATN